MKNSTLQGLFWKFAAFLFLFFFNQPAYSGEFDLSEQDPTVVVTIPGTDMKGGMFRYIINGPDETFKAGILIGNEVLYYAGWPNPGGDCNFGVYKDYFLMDCYNYGASHNRIMYLFRFGKGKVELLDVLREAYPAHTPGMDFMSAFKGEREIVDTTPIWMEVNDYDGDGNPEIKLDIIRLDEYEFDLYLELKGDRLNVDLNPKLYKPLFDKEKKRRGQRQIATHITSTDFWQANSGLRR